MYQVFSRNKILLFSKTTPLAFVLLLLTTACKKESVDDAEFKFSHMSTTDTMMQSRSFIGITAHTTGSIKEFLWDAKDKNGTSAGAFFGSGNVVEWHICCADTFYINCTAVGHNNESISKSIKIISYD